MGSSAPVIPVVPPRQPRPKSSNENFPDNLPVVQPMLHPKNKTKPTPPKNYSSRLTDAEWEEIRDILRPGLPFNLFHGNSSSSNGTKNGNSTLPYSAQPHQSLKVLGVCLSVLLLSFLVLCCRFCWERRQRKGYSPAPSNPPENPKNYDDDVIAEVVNRREQTPVNQSPSKPDSQKSLYYNRSNQSQPTYDATKSTSQTSTNKPIVKDPSNISANSRKSDGVKFASEQKSEPLFLNGSHHSSFHEAKTVTGSPSSPALMTALYGSSAACPLNDVKPLKLIPVENLVIPRTFNDALEKVFPDMAKTSSQVDIDSILTLNHLEKSRSKPKLVLRPIPSNLKMNISVEPDIPEKVDYTSARPEMPSLFRRPPLQPFQRDDLSPDQKEEERLKFLRACWHSDMRRRRSLCSLTNTNNEGLLDTKLYNRIVHSESGNQNFSRRVQSMPTMMLTAFNNSPKKPPHGTTYSTDALGFSPMWSPPSFGPPPLENEVRSRSSSTCSNFQDDWKHLRKPLPPTAKAFSAPQEENVHPSVTSLWSLMASEEKGDSYFSEDDEINTEDELPLDSRAGVEAIKMDIGVKNNDEIKTPTAPLGSSVTIETIETDDDPGDRLSNTITERKKSLSCMDFIVESAKSTAHKIPETLENSASKESLTLESDPLPSEIFPIYTKSGTTSSATSVDSLFGNDCTISRLLDKGPSTFWDSIGTRNANPIQGGSGIGSRKTLEAVAVAGTTRKETTPFHNKMDASNLLNSEKVNVKNSALEKH